MGEISRRADAAMASSRVNVNAASNDFMPWSGGDIAYPITFGTQELGMVSPSSGSPSSVAIASGTGAVSLSDAVRSRVIENAPRWADTPYAPDSPEKEGGHLFKYRGGNAARLVGADCSGFVYALYRESGASDYSYTSTAAFAKRADAGEIPFVKVSEPMPGDVALFPVHMAVYDDTHKGGNLWSAYKPGIPLAQAKTTDFGTPIYYRYSSKK
jgi:cell wall-associated NlpC family hydrolase